ncbi:hypothetical protein [Asticcacaulis solisilvae]|uniref:hypothetical protein n=1 Tax=Asticcacaulis solisilvae TaxID=1217274 RepID=UPI003FD80514
MHVFKSRLSVHVMCAAAAVMTLAAPAMSQAADVIGMGNMTKGYTYYNLPGTSATDHTDAVKACAAEAYKVRSRDAEIQYGQTYIYTYVDPKGFTMRGETANIVGGVIGNIIVAQMVAGWSRGVYAAAFENCMVVRGWRVVRLPQDEGLSLAQLAPADLAVHLAPWTGADQPHGEIVRTFKNDAASASTRYLYFRPAHNNDGLLSLTAVTGTSLDKVDMSLEARPTAIQIDKKWPQKGLTPDQIATTLPEAGVIVMRVTGTSNNNGVRLTLARMGTDPNVRPALDDHMPDLITVGQLKDAGRDGSFAAFAVPPGRWRIAAVAGMVADIGFCMGSPSFPVEAGQVVYAGSFDLSAADLGPDLSLEAPKAWLAGKSAADTIRPAVYMNGSQAACGYNGIYALELKGVPNDPDYHWGSAAAVAHPAAPEAVPATNTPTSATDAPKP